MWARATAAGGQSGQAAVESALTLPLAIFLILGTLQLFLMLQARIMTQYAAYKAVRAGSLNYGDCERMKQAAIASLLPTITAIWNPAAPASSPAKLAAEFRLRYVTNHNRYAGAADGGANSQIIEIVREQPTNVAGIEDFNFDSPRGTPLIQRVEIRMLYWYRLKIPFADWVMTKMFLAYFGIQPYVGWSNPTMPVQKANWTATTSLLDEGWPGGSLAGNMASWAGAGHYFFPIKVNAVMRMMTPPKAAFINVGCSVP